MRQYGVQQLERTGETAPVRDQHLRWCVALAEQAAPALQGPEQAAWLPRLAREHDNLHAALQWALDCGHGALGLRLTAGLWQFWRSRSHLREGRHWLAALLALPTGDDAASLAVRARRSKVRHGWPKTSTRLPRPRPYLPRAPPCAAPWDRTSAPPGC